MWKTGQRKCKTGTGILIGAALFIFAGLSAQFNRTRPTARTPGISRPATAHQYAQTHELPKPRIARQVQDPDESSIDIFISNEGNDNNNGEASASPKKTIDAAEKRAGQIAASSSTINLGLKAGDVFREQLDAIPGLAVRTYSAEPGQNTFARLSGMEIVSNGWTKAPGLEHLYINTITHHINTVNGGYHFLVLYEIDTLLEKTHPFAARRMMQMAASADAANAMEGSYYTSILNATKEDVYINTSDNATPGAGRYRYEISLRDFAINAPNRVQLERLIIEPSGHGYGNGFGDSTLISRCIFNGYGTHAVVFKSGVIEKSLFIQGAKGLSQGSIPVVNYEVAGAGNYSRLSGNIFLGTQTGPYAHQSGRAATYHEEMVYDSNQVFGDTGYTDVAFGADLVKSVTVKNNYAENIRKYWTGSATELLIEHNIFNNVVGRSGISTPSNEPVNAKLRNNFIKTGGHSGNQFVNDQATGFYFVNNAVRLQAENNIFHLKTDWTGNAQPVSLFAALASNVQFRRNIIICDVPPGHRARVISVDKNNRGQFAADSNVYVILRGDGFLWTALNPANGEANITSLSRWQAETGQDAASIVIDLRNNAHGLKGLFRDPANGDYHFAPTFAADKVKELKAGMANPPYTFACRPSKDEAAQSIMREEVAQAAPVCNPASITAESGQVTISGLDWAPEVVVNIFNAGRLKVYEQRYTNPPDEIRVSSLVPGTYLATLSFFANKCTYLCDTSMQVIIEGVVTAPDTQRLAQVSVGPNPFANNLNVFIESEQGGQATLLVRDLSGRQLETKVVDIRKGRNAIRMDQLGRYATGTYFLQVNTPNGTDNFKLLKQ
jgi:hypothetical protein